MVSDKRKLGRFVFFLERVGVEALLDQFVAEPADGADAAAEEDDVAVLGGDVGGNVQRHRGGIWTADGEDRIGAGLMLNPEPGRGGFAEEFECGDLGGAGGCEVFDPAGVFEMEDRESFSIGERDVGDLLDDGESDVRSFGDLAGQFGQGHPGVAGQMEEHQGRWRGGGDGWSTGGSG